MGCSGEVGVGWGWLGTFDAQACRGVSAVRIAQACRGAQSRNVSNASSRSVSD
jgi:hypothetical protein